MLTTHPFLAPRLKTSRVVLLLPLHAFMASRGAALPMPHQDEWKTLGYTLTNFKFHDFVVKVTTSSSRRNLFLVSDNEQELPLSCPHPFIYKHMHYPIQLVY